MNFSKLFKEEEDSNLEIRRGLFLVDVAADFDLEELSFGQPHRAD